MAKGGKRPGSGRPKGSKDKLQADAHGAAERIKASMEQGLTPLEYLLAVMRNERETVEIRMEAARTAAPYIHRKQPQDVKIDAVIYTPPPVVLVHTAPEEAAGDDGGSPLN